jgi:hypothetical protein
MLWKRVLNSGAYVLDRIEREVVRRSNLFDYNLLSLFS